MASLPDEMRSIIQDIVLSHFRNISSGSTTDLYESMKALSWKLILGIFISSSTERDQAQKDIAEIKALQEDLLRGQFSLFPVSINIRLWQSPRARGLAARKKLQQLLKARISNGKKGCPFATKGGADEDDVANHLLLFTSSLAVKSLASLLTAIMLNLYINPNGSKHQDSQSPATRILSLEIAYSGDELLQSIILETERLSSPVVGIMRRTVQDVTLLSGYESTQDTIIPKGWDIWLYFVGAARDPAVFGDTAELFRPERYYRLSKGAESEKKGLVFGAGPKSCLGETLVREVMTTVAKTCLSIGIGSSSKVGLQANIDNIPRGVQGWLGWLKDVKPEE